ncbi:MAG: hypothetical protein FGM24_02870 [Candidatus Kapabacteria bacterium]|nr:hypothetical protein [Candidatus Kapabacteria bacterium]
MTYPPTPQASPLHHRNLVFTMAYSILAAGVGVGLRALIGRDLGLFHLVTLAPTSLFLITVPPVFAEYRYWLKRLAWWTFAAALGLTVWMGTLMLLDGFPALLQLVAGTVLAEIVLIGTLQFGCERNPHVTWKTIVIMAVGLGLIYALIMLFSDRLFGFISAS